jgi:hypothetical protein
MSSGVAAVAATSLRPRVCQSARPPGSDDLRQKWRINLPPVGLGWGLDHLQSGTVASLLLNIF